MPCTRKNRPRPECLRDTTPKSRGGCWQYCSRFPDAGHKTETVLSGGGRESGIQEKVGHATCYDFQHTYRVAPWKGKGGGGHAKCRQHGTDIKSQTEPLCYLLALAFAIGDSNLGDEGRTLRLSSQARSGVARGRRYLQGPSRDQSINTHTNDRPQLEGLPAVTATTAVHS